MNLTRIMDLKNLVKNLLAGMLMGLANIIPGVSGGTAALVMGIYDRLIHSINKIPKDIPISVLKLDPKGVRSRLDKIDFIFLGPLFIGSILAVITIARGLGYLLDTYPAPVYSLFFGLISGSIFVIYKYIDTIDLRVIISALFGIGVISLILTIQGSSDLHHPTLIFIGGMFAIVSMILPGISGSYILIILNQYEYMLEAVYTLDIPVITIFMIGGLVGLFGLAKIMDYLLKKARSVTIAFLFGLMLGALREPLKESVDTATTPLAVVIPAVLGAAVIIMLEYRYISDEIRSKDKEKR